MSQNYKTFEKVAAQGDIYITKIDALPTDRKFEKAKPEGQMLIVTHSETGHHHVMDADAVTLLREVDGPTPARGELPRSIMECFLVVNKPTLLNHLRQYDQHTAIMFKEGIYHVRRQQEYTPEGLRQVAD